MHKGMSPINRKAKLNILINRLKMDVPSTCTHKTHMHTNRRMDFAHSTVPVRGVLWDCGDASKDRSHSGLTEQGGGLI